MNKLEFTKVLNKFDIDNCLSKTTGKKGEKEEVHYWNNCAIYFNGTYYTVINGKIPYEVAKTIYEKYPNKEYKIRVEGGCEDWQPEQFVTDEKYEKAIKEIKKNKENNIEKIHEIINKEDQLLKKRTSKDKFIKTYHIDTLEGLAVFIKEMEKYNNNIDIDIKNKIDEIYMEIIQDIKPNINNKTWLKTNQDLYKIYENTRKNNSKTTYGKMFLEVLDDFDNAINPFMNNNYIYENIDSDRLSISGTKYDIKDYEKNEFYNNCCELIIKDKKTGNKTTYLRTPNCFSYQLEYNEDNDNKIVILHYFTNKDYFNENKGENIYINKYGKKYKKEYDIRLNLTDNTIGRTYQEKEKITKLNEEQKTDIYLDLLSGVNMAKMITLENLNNQNQNKKRILKVDNK